MSKNKFKPIPKRSRDSEAIEAFAGGADVKANEESEKRPVESKTKKEGFYTTLDPEYKERIQALAYFLRLSQREVIEKALDQKYPLSSSEVKDAKKQYRKSK
ncbi:MAG: hypothetical protein JJU37_12935 [Balneolaceae bacterium]|nr:hypothetical protein [Balneolaceae bacterium]